MEKHPKPEFDKSHSPLYTTTQLGVWRVLIAKSTFKLLNQNWKDVFSIVILLGQFVTDIYVLAPELFVLVILTQLWTGLEPSLILYTSNRLLTIIEASLVHDRGDINAILNAVLAHLICTVITSTIKWWGQQLQPRLHHKIKYHFEELLLQANLKKDLPTSHETSSKSSARSEDAWDSFEKIMSFSAEVFSTASQLGFILQLSRDNHSGPVFGAICISQPVLDFVASRCLWTKTYIVHANNEDYRRLRALHDLTQDMYKQEIISGNVADYIIAEYGKARKSLGDTSADWPECQYGLFPTPTWDIFSGVVSNLPMIYYAVNAIRRPSSFSIASIAVLQQISDSLRWTLSKVAMTSTDLPKQLDHIKKIYDTLKVDNKINDGNTPYPSNALGNTGMSLEVRNVSFKYPGSTSTRDALTKASFSIKSGELVVIVGPNGSGKSSIVKVLNRLYDPTSGEIFVDGQPLNTYRISDIRESIANLSQDHSLYPLSIRENIGLGHPSSISNMDMISQSAKLGGAFELVSRFDNGFDATLQPVQTAYSRGTGDGHPLKELLNTLEKQTDVSGGEKQRLVASRTFMRLNSDKIKCVTVDEPSSALDPQGELELFQRLRDAQAGRTMIFVTHRFGHLTKHADLIICMKDGTVAQTGTHEELLANDGEYAKLYNIQAGAFLSEGNTACAKKQEADK